METFTKEKSNDLIHFPEVLDMRPFVRPCDNMEATETDNTKIDDYIYELTAVLIHQGDYAHYGHYIAHVRRTM
jgi:uncharacterized UBP type Zn finger protein